MSFGYELVLSFDLKAGVDAAVLDEVRWRFGIGAAKADLPEESPWQLPEDDHSGPLPGGEFTRFEREYRFDSPSGPEFAQALFIRRRVGDDTFADCVVPLLEFVASIATNGNVGFFRSDFSLIPTAVIVRDGHAYITTDDGSVGPATTGAPPFT